MATDFYRYEGRTKTLIIEVMYYDYIEPKCIHIGKITDLNGKRKKCNKKKKESIVRAINEGRIRVKYLGGHNHSGEYWGSDNKRRGINENE